jgi:hypothetical protein
MSDRVSTILVWKNLVVSTREDKKKQFFQRLTRKNPEPKSKRLLHNVSGAITGGLWAVMGKFLFASRQNSTYFKSHHYLQVHPVLVNQLF